MKRLDISDFDGFFGIMQKSFPTDEYRTEEGQRRLFGLPEYTVYGQYRGNRLVGFMALWEFDSFRYGEHFAVDPELRNSGIGSAMTRELFEGSDKPLIVEVECPDNDLARRRIAFYQRNGYVLNDYEYFQPPLRPGQEPLPLMIMSHPRGLTREEFEAVRSELYAKVYTNI